MVRQVISQLDLTLTDTNSLTTLLTAHLDDDLIMRYYTNIFIFL